MTFRMRDALAVLWLALGVIGCGSDSPATPTRPSPFPEPLPIASSPEVTGVVLDTAFRPLADARVEVVDGPHAGISTLTSDTGAFMLAGTFTSATRFRATKEGHFPATQAWTCSGGSCAEVNGSQPWLGFYLRVVAAPVDISGVYTLALVADAACADLPDHVRTRTYTATITPGANPNTNVVDGTSFTLTVSGATLFGDFPSLGIGVAGDYLGFWLYGGHDPALVEVLAPGTYLAFSGNAEASVATSGLSTISARLDGWIEYCATASPMRAGYRCDTSAAPTDPTASPVLARVHCESANHRLVLTRR